MLSAEEMPGEPMKPEVAYIVANMMSSVIEDPSGTDPALTQIGRPAAGKTGTANEHRDAWFIGFTPSLLAGGWVGFDTHEMLGPYETGGHAAGPMWVQWMRAATAGQPLEEWPAPPPGVVQVQINRNNGCLSGSGDPYAAAEVFMAGSQATPGRGGPQQPGPGGWYQTPPRRAFRWP